MIEVKSVLGHVLYTAENATDIRQAVEAACASGANLQYAYLQDANLQYAYLQGANLQYAYLQDANLQYANLQYANLQDANLQYAYLQDANLQYANLQYANLQYAYLQDANLQYAYLQDANLQDANLQYANLQYANLQDANLQYANLQYANLQDAIWERVAKLLSTSIQAMNDGGRHWIQGKLTLILSDGSTAYCARGSICAQNDEGTVEAIALWLLGSVCVSSIESFNDHPDTTWEDVQAVFAIAIKHANRFAAAPP